MILTRLGNKRKISKELHAHFPKHKISGGHNGMSAPQFNQIFHSFLEKLSQENKLIKRPTIHGESYFLNQLYYANSEII